MLHNRLWVSVVTVGVLMSGLMAPSWSEPTLEETIAELRRMEFVPFDSESSEAFVDKWGPGCIPQLIDLTKADSPASEFAVFTLGVANAPEAIDAITQHIVDHESLPSERRKCWGYHALARIDSDRAYSLLKKRYEDTDNLDIQSRIRQALGFAYFDRTVTLMKELGIGGETLERAEYLVETRDAQQRALSVKPADTPRMQTFWRSQRAIDPDIPFPRTGVRYEGNAYWSDWYGKGRTIEGAYLEFDPDGTFTTNLRELVEPESRNDHGPPELSDTPLTSRYYVPGPGMLSIGPGQEKSGITAYSISFTKNTLAFFHHPSLSYISLGLPEATRDEYTIADIVGNYEGRHVIRGEQRSLKEVDARLIFADNGSFAYSWGSDGNWRGNYTGSFCVDPLGKLVMFTNASGGDYIAGNATYFDNWRFENGSIHANDGLIFPLSTAATPDIAKPPFSGNAIFKGVVYMADPDETLRAYPETTLTLLENGIYNWGGSFASVLGARRSALQGSYFFASPSGLVLDHIKIRDLHLTHDTLKFTSLKLGAYFVLDRQ